MQSQSEELRRTNACIHISHVGLIGSEKEKVEIVIFHLLYFSLTLLEKDILYLFVS